MDNNFYIIFVRQNSFYGDFACKMIGSSYHHVCVAYFDKTFKDYLCVEVSHPGGIKLLPLRHVLSLYDSVIEIYRSNEDFDKNKLYSFVYKTLGWQYDLKLLVKNFFRLIWFNLSSLMPKKMKKENKKRTCSEWATEMLKHVGFDFDLIPEITSPEHLRQKIINNSSFTLCNLEL